MVLTGLENRQVSDNPALQSSILWLSAKIHLPPIY